MHRGPSRQPPGDRDARRCIAPSLAARLLGYGRDVKGWKKLREDGVVVRQARGGHLMPGCAPGQDVRPEDFRIGHGREVGVAQANDIEGKKLEVPQVHVNGNQRIGVTIAHSVENPFGRESPAAADVAPTSGRGPV